MFTSPVERSTERERVGAVEDLFDGLVRFGRAMRARGADWADVVADLTRGDIVTLGLLEARGSCRPGQVAAALNVDPSVVSRQVAGLHALGLVARSTDPDDGRAELISLTDPGRERLLAARTATCGVLAERLDHWDLEDIARATAVVCDLADRLHPPVPSKDTHV